MNQKTIQPGWCDGCNPDNCSGCATPTAPVDAGKYPELPEWSKRDDLGGLSPSEVRQALRTYVDADRAARVAAASKPQVKEARERRRWLSDSFNRGTQTLDEATVSARAMALSLATAPASIITASVMRDDGGEHPAFCLMVAYRTEKAAMAALAMLTAVPAGMEPVATVLFSSTGWRTLVDALASLEDGTKLYTESQVQAMLAAVPRNATLYDPDDVAFPVQRSADGADALPPELASIARPTSIAAAEATSAPIKAGEYPPLVCDYCGALTPDPWHSSGMLHGKMSKHIHSCDACEALEATQAAPIDADVQQDAERLDFLIEQRAYVVSDPSICDGYWLHYARPNGETWVQSNEHTTPRAAIDAARKQGGAT